MLLVQRAATVAAVGAADVDLAVVVGSEPLAISELRGVVGAERVDLAAFGAGGAAGAAQPLADRAARGRADVVRRLEGGVVRRLHHDGGDWPWRGPEAA